MNKKIPASWSHEYKKTIYDALKEEMYEEYKKELEPEDEGILYTHISTHEEAAKEILKNPLAIRGLATGYRRMDKKLGGLDKGELIIVAGKGGTGKTMFALNLMMQAMLSREQPDIPTLIFSLEMTRQALTARLLQLNEGRFPDNIIPSLPIGYYDCLKEPTIERMRKALTQFREEWGLELVIIDHLHYFSSDIGNQVNEIGKIVRDIKRLAIEFNVPIILLAQMRKAPSGTSQDRTMTSDDIRDSGMIQADADMVIILNRTIISSDSNELAKLKVRIEKNRNKGGLGGLIMRISPHSYRLVEQAEEYGE